MKQRMQEMLLKLQIHTGAIITYPDEMTEEQALELAEIVDMMTKVREKMRGLDTSLYGI